VPCGTKEGIRETAPESGASSDDRNSSARWRGHVGNGARTLEDTRIGRPPVPHPEVDGDPTRWHRQDCPWFGQLGHSHRAVIDHVMADYRCPV